MKLTKEQVLGIVRHTLTFVGGIVVMKGLVDEATVTEIIGGVMTLTGTIWVGFLFNGIFIIKNIMDFNFDDKDEYGKNPFKNRDFLTAEDLLNFLEDLESDDVDLSQIAVVFEDGHRTTEIRDVFDDIEYNVIVLKK